MSKTCKKVLSVVLSLTMLLAFAPATLAFAEDAVHIASAEDFAAFAENGGDAVLDADIDLGTLTAAYFSAGYSGEFDGNGHSVAYSFSSTFTGFRGLFHTVAEGAVIKNLTVKNTAGEDAMILGKKKDYHGGIAYQNYGTIEKCVNEMNMSSSGSIMARYVGGIAGKNLGVIRDCVNNGNLDVNNFCGGIVGENRGGSLYNCVNNGAISVKNVAGYAGGIVGVLGANAATDVVTIENCTNKGVVAGGSGDYGCAGGVIGQVNIPTSAVTYTSKPSITIKGCVNAGTVSAGKEENTDDVIGKNNNVDNSDITIETGVPAHQHTYDDGVEISRASCTAKGEIVYTCTSCDEGAEGHTYTEYTDMLAHTPGDWELGEYEGAQTYVKKCTECGVVVDVDGDGAVAFLQNARQALQDAWFRLTPTFGKDVNVNAILTDQLVKLGYNGVNVSVKNAENPEDGAAAIADDGEITYFYADPNGFRPMWFSQIPVTFTFEKNGQTVDYSINAVINWDADKAVQAIEDQIAVYVTADAIKGENDSLDAVTENLVLPKAVTDENGERKLWSLITWTCSDAESLALDDSAQSSADTLFEPYTGVIKRGMDDKTVTLTATFSFQRASYDEAAISLEKTFTLTIKGVGDEIKAEMQKALDENYTVEKLTYMGSKEPIDPANVTYDIQLLIPRASGIENNADYTFEVTSDNSDVAYVNVARVFIYRPLPGSPAVDVTLTVKMTNQNYSGIYVTKEIPLTVAPIAQTEIDAQLKLMEDVKAAFFAGINDGANASADQVTENLHAFYEAVYDADGNLEWHYTYADVTDKGIAAVAIDPMHPSEAWDKFQSDDPDVITHENLLVNRQKEDATVTIYACLSSTQFERYAELYPDNADFDKLYRQEVLVTLTVPGTDPTATPDTPDTPDDAGNDSSTFFNRFYTLIMKILNYLSNLLDQLRDKL